MKIRQALFFLLFLFLPFSCQKEDPGKDPEPTPVPEGYVSFELKNADSKTVLDGQSIKWKSGDKIRVNGGTYFVQVAKDGSACVVVPKATSYQAFYPAEICTSTMVMIQPIQYHQTGSFGTKANPARGTVEGNDMIFSSLFGILHLKISGSGSIASVAVKDNAGGKLCGTFTLSGGTLQPSGELSSSSICLDCKTTTNEGASLTASGTDFYLVLPPGDYNSGFTITISGKDCKSMTVNSTTPRKIVANEILNTPVIEYKTDEKQIFSFHFDSMVFGGDPVKGCKGFKINDPAAVTGYDFSTAVCTATDAGCNPIAKSANVADLGVAKTYLYSKNIQGFNALHQVQEFAGYVGVAANGLSQGVIKFPAMTNLPSGKVCKAVITFKMALQEGHSSSAYYLLNTYSTNGKVLELWIDGSKVADYTPQRTAVTGSMGDDTRWATAQTKNGIEPAAMATERVLVKAGELSVGKWHDIKLVMGAVTPNTTLEFGAQATASTSSAFFIDDLEAVYEDYDLPSKDKILPFSCFVSPGTTSTLDKLKLQGTALGIGPYIDVSIGTTFFSNRDWDDAKVSAGIATWVANVEATGYKVWSIHLPATDENGSFDKDIFEFFHYDAVTRQAAVDRMIKILKWVKPFKAVNLMVHATGPGRASKDSRYYYENAKDNGVAAFRQMNDFCKSSEMRYADGTYPVFCIENIQNTGTTVNNVCAKAEYMNYYCSKVPSMKVCFDSSHAQVCDTGGETAMEYLRILGTNVGCLHMHGNGRTTKDCHIYPGYKNGLGYDYALNDIMDWGLMYKILLEDCKYSGPFTYEGGNNYKDQIWSFNNMAHNYYGYILTEYNKLK